MLTIILTIILFCILAAIYALYAGKIDGGVGPIDDGLRANLMAKWIINTKLFYEEDEILAKTVINLYNNNHRKLKDYTEPVINKCDRIYRATGCPNMDTSNVCANIQEFSVKYVFPEICAVVHVDFDNIDEPSNRYYAALNHDMDIVNLVRETMEIYRPLLKADKYDDIITTIFNIRGFGINCNPTDDELKEHWVEYVGFLITRGRYNDAYEYILSKYDETLTIDKNLDYVQHFTILQFMFEKTSTRGFCRDGSISQNDIFYYAIIFVYIANKISRKNVAFIAPENINMSDDKLKYLNYDTFYVSPVLQYASQYIGTSNRRRHKTIVYPHKIIEYIINIIADHETVEVNKQYVKNKLTAELQFILDRYIQYEFYLTIHERRDLSIKFNHDIEIFNKFKQDNIYSTLCARAFSKFAYVTDKDAPNIQDILTQLEEEFKKTSSLFIYTRILYIKKVHKMRDDNRRTQMHEILIIKLAEFKELLISKSLDKLRLAFIDLIWYISQLVWLHSADSVYNIDLFIIKDWLKEPLQDLIEEINPHLGNLTEELPLYIAFLEFLDIKDYSILIDFSKVNKTFLSNYGDSAKKIFCYLDYGHPNFDSIIKQMMG